MSYINIKHTNPSGVSETVKHPTRYSKTYGLLFTMFYFYIRLSNDPLPKFGEPREVKLKWYLDKISEFHKSLRYEARGNKYRYSIDIENSKHYVRGILAVHSGSDIVISTPYMSLDGGIYSDLFEFETRLLDPSFYIYHAVDFDIDINNWTLEDEKLICGVLSKHAHVRIALSKLFDEYISKLRKMIGELKDDKISKKLIDEMSLVNLKHIWKYERIREYCDKLNQLYGTKNENLPSYINTVDFCYFISSYKKLGEFFVNHTPPHKTLQINT